MKTFTLTLAALLMLGAPALLSADENLPKDKTVWDRIGDDDQRVVGHVTFVNDDTFELRTSNGAMIFPTPDQPGIVEHLSAGNRIQVWYDPELRTERLAGRITYIESYELLPDEGELEQDVDELLDDADAALEEAGEEIDRQNAQAWSDIESETTEVVTEAETSDGVGSGYSGSTLPQTASAIPSRALAGMFLIGLGALVWGGLRRS